MSIVGICMVWSHMTKSLIICLLRNHIQSWNLLGHANKHCVPAKEETSNVIFRKMVYTLHYCNNFWLPHHWMRMAKKKNSHDSWYTDHIMDITWISIYLQGCERGKINVKWFWLNPKYTEIAVMYWLWAGWLEVWILAGARDFPLSKTTQNGIRPTMPPI